MKMSNTVAQRAAAKKFATAWDGRGYEKGETQAFWRGLLADIFGVDNVDQKVEFEKEIATAKNQKRYIDAFIPETKVLIEQKSIGKDLTKAYRQSDGAMLTPYEQALRYIPYLKPEEHPRYIVTCNFSEFRIYDQNDEKPASHPTVIELKELGTDYYRLGFLVPGSIDRIQKEVAVSVKAGELVGRLYDAFAEEYEKAGGMTDADMHQLNVLCVRLVFCLYAEDSGLFGAPDAFCHYLETFENVSNAQSGLRDLFKVLDMKTNERPRFLDERLKGFPYVNGGLFHDDVIEIPPITEKIYKIIVDDMSKGFNWSVISPTIFGAVFESTLNPETRRKGGMHYTSVENIHKVIDPLFLDDLKEELQKITDVPDRDKFAVRKGMTELKATYRMRLEAFQEKLASLKFLDPACGSGNFLTETFVSLRRLENKVIGELALGQMLLDVYDPIKVSIRQFYGIEINDFAVTVAKTALWIAESQMMQETEDIIDRDIDFLPLKTNAFVHEGNALQMDWESVLPQRQCSYVLGNPPFVGARIMSSAQKKDMECVFEKGWKNLGELDYVACWYKKAIDYIKNTNIQCAFVSTNSISQGTQVAALWKKLFEEGCNFQFAYRTFRWDSESNNKAHVHVVIIGFSTSRRVKKPVIFANGTYKEVDHINAYLTNGPDVFIESRSKPICDVPSIGIGNQPIDGGNYLFTKEEMENFVKKEPLSKKYFKKWYGSVEFIHQKPRYCLWLGDCTPHELSQMPACLERVNAVRKYRLASKRPGTQKIASMPTRFHHENMPNGNYLLIPEVSSQRRKYIPMGYMDNTCLCSNKVRLMPNAGLYEFGILESNVHMAWMRAVCCRLKSDYSYSSIYNNFPWPEPTPAQKVQIEHTAKGILEARAVYPKDSLADLYDPLLMPPDLRKAHAENDKAVMTAYGFNRRKMNESDCVAELMKMYQKLTADS